jgi:hypothetical protein
MKKIFIGLLVLSSVSAFAEGMDIQKCTKKVSKAAKALASLEIGSSIQVSESVQESLSTATNFTVTVVNTKRPAQVVYSIKTIDISEDSRCVVDKIEMK